MMIKIMALLFVVIAPTLAGILVVVVLASSSPVAGGQSISQGVTILMVVAGAVIAAIPISFMVARMINNTIIVSQKPSS